MVFFFQAEDGIRDLVRSRGLGDVYKRQEQGLVGEAGEVEVRVREDRGVAGAEPAWSEVAGLSLIHI